MQQQTMPKSGILKSLLEEIVDDAKATENVRKDESIIDDAKATENEAIVAEENAQKGYEHVVKDSDAKFAMPDPTDHRNLVRARRARSTASRSSPPIKEIIDDAKATENEAIVSEGLEGP